MKKIIFAFVAFMMTTSMMAQQFGQRREFKPEDMATRQATELKDSCSLNEEQYTAVYNLYLEQSKQMQAAMQQGGQGQRQQFDREAMQKRQEEFNGKLKAILTEEQYARYEQMQKNRMQRWNRGQQGRGQGRGQGGQRGDRPRRDRNNDGFDN